MKLSVYVKTGKGNRSSEKDIDKTVDESAKVLGFLEKKGWTAKKCNCYPDGTETIFEKLERGAKWKAKK